MRSYFDEEAKQWKDSVSYGRDDLPRVRLVTDQAYESVFLKSQEMAREESDGKSFTEKLDEERSAGRAATKRAAAQKGGKGAKAS